MKRIIYILSIIALFSTSAYSQGMFSISYDIGLPIGETSNFIGNASFRGFGVEGRGFITDNLSYGGSFNWAVFYEETGPQTWEGVLPTVLTPPASRPSWWLRQAKTSLISFHPLTFWPQTTKRPALKWGRRCPSSPASMFPRTGK